MSIAVIKTGGKQYKVSEGDQLKIEKLIVAKSQNEAPSTRAKHSTGQVKSQKKNQQIEFDDILDGKKVIAEIVNAGKERKIKVFKFKAKKRYKRTYGHRQPYSQIEIKEIK